MEASPPPVTAPGVILLGPPEGDAGGEQRDQDIQMHDSSAPTEENLGASQIGAEPAHDKSPVAPEHPEPQPRQDQDAVMQEKEQDQRQEKQQQRKEQDQQDQPDP